MSGISQLPVFSQAQRALDMRAELLDRLAAEGTDAVRLFHGVAEGLPGVTVDRYGPIVLAQSFREPLDARVFEALRTVLSVAAPGALWIANHRGKGGNAALSWQQPETWATARHIAHEAGMGFEFAARHRGQDPWLFLDFRAARRRIRAAAQGCRVLNTFAYTCTAGVAAALGGARSVCNVDFSQSALAVGLRNQALNPVEGVPVRNVQEDFFCCVRQFAGLAVRRRGRRRAFTRYPGERFDLAILDPPRWARGAFGTVDVVRDYQSLFKPVLLAMADEGQILATNHVASVDLDTWTGALRRCAEKAGRPIRDLEVFGPEADFPSFDQQPPLKQAWIRL